MKNIRIRKQPLQKSAANIRIDLVKVVRDLMNLKDDDTHVWIEYKPEEEEIVLKRVTEEEPQHDQSNPSPV